ncbi:MAG: hypothetical protein SQA66_12070 [Candidatus Fervidibacter sacchari]
MTALIWAQGRQLMRLRQQWQTLLFFVVFAFIGLVAAIWVWISENVFLKPLPNRQVFWLVLAFLSSLPSFADPQNFIPRLPEWKLAQPIPARTMTVFLWLSEFANLFCFSPTPHIASDCERINSVEGSSGCSGYHDTGCCRRSERLLGSSVGIVRNDWMAHEIGTYGQVVENVGEGFSNKCNCFVRAFRCLS